MKIENTFNIPSRILDKLVQEPRRKKPKRMSVTDLIKPPRIRTLYIERFDDIVVDASTYFNLWFGNLLDSAFEDDENAQNKMEIEIDGITLVGKWDAMVNEIIEDDKFTKVGRKTYEDTMKEFTAQLNIYDWMNNTLNWQRAKGLRNNLFYKDWSPILASFDKSYPQCSWEAIDQPQWTVEEQHRYILERLKYHKEKPYDCPESERWGSFCIRRKGAKKALVASVPGTKGKEQIKTEAQAKEILIAKGYEEEFNKGDIYIENRIGLRCKFFCGVSSVCPDSPNCIKKYREEKL
jgi:hypothetical protein